MSCDNKVSWWEPAAKCWPETKQELIRSFSAAAIIRIALLVVGITVVAAFVIQRQMPDLEFNWVTATLKALGIFVIVMAVSMIFPRLITVNDHGIFVQHGQTCKQIKAANIAEATIDTVNRTLCLRLRDREKLEIFHFSGKVDISKLKPIIEVSWKHPRTVEDARLSRT